VDALAVSLIVDSVLVLNKLYMVAQCCTSWTFLSSEGTSL